MKERRERERERREGGMKRRILGHWRLPDLWWVIVSAWAWLGWGVLGGEA